MKKKRLLTLGLVAAVLMTLSAAAYAINQAVGTPQAAQRVALQEIERWKELGLLNPEVQFEGESNQIVEIKEHKGNESWYGRIFSHSHGSDPRSLRRVRKFSVFSKQSTMPVKFSSSSFIEIR